MPGKQMSIDAELRAGHIDHNEARRRRTALARESQLFGSMDGVCTGSPMSTVGRSSANVG
jgi:type III secretory pathway component EscV